VTIRRECGVLVCLFLVEFEPTHLPSNTKSIGLDMGLETFGRRSDGCPSKTLANYRRPSKTPSCPTQSGTPPEQESRNGVVKQSCCCKKRTLTSLTNVKIFSTKSPTN